MAFVFAGERCNWRVKKIPDSYFRAHYYFRAQGEQVIIARK